eukprot:gene3946-8828_t
MPTPSPGRRRSALRTTCEGQPPTSLPPIITMLLPNRKLLLPARERGAAVRAARGAESPPQLAKRLHWPHRSPLL